MLLYEIIFYDTADGKCPVQDFLDSLEPKFLAKTLRTIDLLETNGPLLREPYSKLLENGIFELRTKHGSDINRVFYFFIIGQKIILTNGIIKKTAKTPKSAIDLAKKYKTDYEWRHRNEPVSYTHLLYIFLFICCLLFIILPAPSFAQVTAQTPQLQTRASQMPPPSYPPRASGTSC